MLVYECGKLYVNELKLVYDNVDVTLLNKKPFMWALHESVNP